MDWSPYYKILLALVCWREARGEGRDGMRAVAHVCRNRVVASHLPDSWDTIITRKFQFSSLTAPGDSQLVVWPKKPNPQFEDAMDIAVKVYAGDDFDLTNGATFYWNPKIATSADFKKNVETGVFVKVMELGSHEFFKERGK